MKALVVALSSRAFLVSPVLAMVASQASLVCLEVTVLQAFLACLAQMRLHHP
jgi:hypothetical protein